VGRSRTKLENATHVYVCMVVKSRCQDTFFGLTASRLIERQFPCSLISSDPDNKSSIWTHEEGTSIRGEGDSGDAIAGGGVFDIRTYSLEMMKVLLNEVIWARSTANHFHVKLAAEHLKTALNEVAQRYNKLVTMKGEIPQCGSANQ